MSANFTPIFGGYREPGAFRFWCQKVLPLVYDDSLSYYELLCKVVDYINNLIHDNSAMIDNLNSLLTAYNQLQDYVNTYFANLDLTGEVSDKIDEMADNGELLAILAPVTNELTQFVRDEVVAQNAYNAHTRDMVSAMVGQPFMASSASEMTDTSKIYVYVGETTGSLTNGYWYYYNGTAWVEGGEYMASTTERDMEVVAEDVVFRSGISNEIYMESGTYLDVDGATHSVNTARQRNISPICIDSLAGVVIPSGYEMYVFCLDEFHDLIGALPSWYTGYFNVFNCLSGTKYINFAVRDASTPTADISEEIIVPVYFKRNAKNVSAMWNVMEGGIYFDGNNVVVNENGFGVSVDGKFYYIAPVDLQSSTTFTPAVLTSNYYLVIDMNAVTAGVRTNPATAMRLISTLDRDSNSERYIIVASYFFGRWNFVGEFSYFEPRMCSVEPDYVGWNVAPNGIRIVGNTVVVNENGFCIAYHGKVYYIAPTDQTTVTTFNASDATQHLVIDPALLTSVNGRNNPADVMSVVNYFGAPGTYNKKYIYVANFYKNYWDFCGKFQYFNQPVFANHGYHANNIFLEKHMIAHGGGTYAEENTIENFRGAIEAGYKVVECDVQFTSDNIPVLYHDTSFTVGGTTYVIASSTYSALKTAKPNLAKLDDLLLLAKESNICVDIDFTKTYTTAQTNTLYDTIVKYGALSRCMITCFSATARQLLSLSNDVIICISSLAESAISSNTDIIRKSALFFGSVERENVTQALVTAFHNAGILVKAWTVNGESQADTFASYGVDMIITDSLMDSYSVIADLRTKINKPAVAGTNGQVLTSDGAGSQAWESIVIDDTLTISGVAADAKKVGDEITGLKSDFDKRTDYIGYELSLFESATNTGSIKYSDGADNTSSSYNDCKSSNRIAVKSGWTIAYSARNATGNCLIAFYSSNGTYDQNNSVEGTGALKTDVYTVPEDGFIRIACRADIATHTYTLTANGKLQDLQDETDKNTDDIQVLTFQQDELYPTAKMLTGADFVIGTHLAPSESRRIRLANNITSKTGGVYFIVPASNSYGYEVEIMNGSTRVGPSVNAWSYVSGVFKIVYAGVQYAEYNIYMRKSDNSDWTPSDISNVKIIVVDGGKSDSNVVLNIMSHNVGHYNYGTTGGYSGADYADKVTEWKEMLAKTMPDIILIQEYNSPDGRFDSGNNVNAQTALYTPIFKGFYTNAVGGTGVGTIVTKMSLQATWDISVTAGDTRKFACGLINVGDIPVVLCSVHLIPGTDATAIANRESQRNQLITALSGFDRVIIAGDFNANEDSFYAPFVDAGYTICNHGYFGNIITQADGAIDNIILKGLLPYDATAEADNAITSDHYPFISKVRIV